MKSALKKFNQYFELNLFLIFIVFNLFLTFYSTQINNFYALKGQAGFVVLGLFLYLLKNKLRMSNLTYFFLLLGFALHSSHILGNFYYSSPIFIPWDYLVHGVVFIGMTLLIFNYQKERINQQKIFCLDNFLLFIILFLTIAGVGVLIELGEYAGYALLGLEDGALLFGGGDFDHIQISSDVISEMEIHGGGWYDSMSDLLINSYSSLLTLLILFTYHFYRKKS